MWTVDLEATVEQSRKDLSELADELLSQLESIPMVAGATTYAQLDERIIGARFDVDALGPQAAVGSALVILGDAMKRAQQSTFHVGRIEIIEDRVVVAP